MIIKDFNPRSHERSDLFRRAQNVSYIISIHAPTRGATTVIVQTSPVPVISIHAPTRGATFTVLRFFFQMIISIHAPTRGATWHGFRSLAVRHISIHAPTRGATAILHKKFVYFYTIPTINI